jgi:hypothetical protein
VLSQTDDPQYGIPVAATEWTVVLPTDVDARPLDDANKTNMAESVEGGEQIIAEYNELLNLYQVLSDATQISSVKSRASNNLKQLQVKVLNDSNSMRVDTNSDSRQSRELQELQGKWQQAQQQMQAQSLQAKAEGAAGEGKPAVSNKDIQRDLVTGNSADFQSSENSPAEDSDDVLSFALQAPAAKKPAAQEDSKKGAKQSGANRRELKQQTAEQSVNLNAAAVAQQEQGQAANAEQASRPATKDVDADEILNESNALAENQSQSRRRSKFKKDESRSGGQMAGEGQSVLWPGNNSLVPNNYNQPLLAGSGTDYNRISGPISADLAKNNGSQIGGGAGADQFTPAFGFTVQDAAEWTAAGGLSLDIAVPQEGQKLTFSKSGGDARLALGLMPRASLEVGFGLGWAIVWSLVGLGLIAALGRADAMAALRRRVPFLAIAVGLAWYFLLPGGPLGFALFVLGAVSFGWQHRRGM